MFAGPRKKTMSTTMANPVAATSDPLTMSLDEVIKERNIVVKRPQNQGYRRLRNSQQWRLGRNGPGNVKRLQRGPLRPYNPRWREARLDGLPPNVERRIKYGHLPVDSVFNRVGWNPLYIIARNRVQIARDFIASRRVNFQPKYRPVSLPMSQTRRYHQPPQNYHRNKFRVQQFLQTKLLQYRRNQLRQQLNRAASRNMYQRRVPQISPTEVNFRRPLLPTPGYVPQELNFTPRGNDNDYPMSVAGNGSQDEPERAVSPTGSIIVELASGGKNPFASNPFASRQNQLDSANPFVSRPVQQTAAYSSAQSYSSVPNYSSTQTQYGSPPQYGSQSNYGSMNAMRQFPLTAGGRQLMPLMK